MNPKEVIAAYRLIERAARDIALETRKDFVDQVANDANVVFNLTDGRVEVEYAERWNPGEARYFVAHAVVSLDAVLERVAKRGWPRWST